jgi:glucose/arabinose dehydrogenase
MQNGAKVIGFALLAAVVLSVAIGHAQQGPGGRQGGGRGQGAGTAPNAAGGSKLPAAENRISPAINWASPQIGDGPFMFESAVPEHRNLRVVVVARLEQPWSATWLPDGSMLVTERPGRLRIIRNGVLDPTPVAGVPPVRAQGLQGLMDVVLHPRFAENRWVYLSYHRPVPAPPSAPSTTPTATNAGAVQPQTPTPQMAGETRIARGVWNGTALTDVRDIFETGATGTESTRMAFGPDGMLYASVSAPGTGPAVERSQDPNDYAGKTIRITENGAVPPDNPFVNTPGYKPAIYTLGHRNGHSMALNPETGQFWVTEQGPNGGDEINILKRGANYGWPFVSHGTNYMGVKISENPTREGTEQPAVVWIPSIAVTGGSFYTGDRFPGWKRNFFVGGLREGETPRTGQMQRIEFNENWQEVRREPMLRELKQRIRDVRQGPDGLLYVLTSENAGALLRIEPGGAANR